MVPLMKVFIIGSRAQPPNAVLFRIFDILKRFQEGDGVVNSDGFGYLDVKKIRIPNERPFGENVRLPL